MAVEWAGSYGTSYADGLAALRRVHHKVRTRVHHPDPCVEGDAVGRFRQRLSVAAFPSPSQEDRRASR
jgi:hypothetical protein